MSKKNLNNNDYLNVLESYNVNDNIERKLKLKKAKIPLRICLKLAFKNIWKKKFRYLVMLIVCTISLAFLAFTIELNGDTLRQNVYTMVENGYQYTEIKKYVPVDDKSDFYAKYNYGDLPSDSYDIIKKGVPELTLHKYEDVNINYAKNYLENKNYFYTGTINTLIEYDETNTYNLLAGRTPTKGTQEIIITDYLIAAFKYFDLVPSYNNYEDYLGIYLDLNWNNNYQVVGIIDTNYEKWVKFSRLSKIDDTIKDNYSFTNDFKMMNAVILNPEYFTIEKAPTGDSLRLTSSNGFNFLITIPENANSNDEYAVNNDFFTSCIFMNSTVAKESIALNTPSYRDYYNQITTYAPTSTYPTSDHEIVLPMHVMEQIYNFTYGYYGRNQEILYNTYMNYVYGKEFKLEIISTTNKKSFTKYFTVVGLTRSEYFILSDNTLKELKQELIGSTESIMVELPKDPAKALSLFKKAYNLRNTAEGIPGYVINVWVYRSDIDSYEVDPFINIMSKGGLFVFTIFTIGIMWTIISIEIVDSKKEIGILRSIGLSGTKVSLIFIIQTLFVNLLAYGLAVKVANEVIPMYNSTITDELGKIILYMYTPTYRTPVFLLIFVLVITILSTVLPLIKIMSQKIIDVINEREK